MCMTRISNSANKHRLILCQSPSVFLCFIQHNAVLDFCSSRTLTFLMSSKIITKFDVLHLIPAAQTKIKSQSIQNYFVYGKPIGFVDSEIFIYNCYFVCKLSVALFCTAVHVFYLFYITDLQYLLTYFVVYFLWKKLVWHVGNSCLHAFNSVNALFTKILNFSYTQKILRIETGSQSFLNLNYTILAVWYQPFKVALMSD